MPKQVRRDEIPGAGAADKAIGPAWAPAVADFLKPLGYRCYHSGKWHVDGMPLGNGFDHSYLLEDQDRYFSPQRHYEDDQPLPPVAPDSGYYATVAIAEHAIASLKRHAAEHPSEPFFQYLAFTCPHFPLHALAEDISKYHDRFAEGWDALRAERLERMKAMGLVHCACRRAPPACPLGPR